jgi:anti-sigma-K factor RskA
MQAHVDELIDGFALGALQPDETRVARAHLDGCTRCRRLLASMQATLVALPDALDELAPRREARLRLLAAARSDLSRVAAAKEESQRPRRLLPFRMDRSSSNPLRRWASVGMAAAFIVGLVGGVTGWAVVLGDRQAPRDDELAKNRDAIETLVRSQRLFTMNSSYRGREVRAIAAAGTNGHATLAVTGLVPAPAGLAYRLWLFSGTNVTSGGVLTPDARGTVVAALNVDLAAFDRMTIALQHSEDGAPGGVTALAGSLK